jgi:pre-mRNA-splicing factor ATP-dependent RNA helicase DHX16
MRKARDIKEQLVELCKRVEIDYENEELSKVDDDVFSNVRKAITSGFFYNTAKLQKSGNYKTLKNSHTVHCHPSSSMFEALPKWVIYHELVLTTKEYMRSVIELDPKWLLEIAPHYYKSSDIEDDEKKDEKKLKVAPKIKN